MSDPQSESPPVSQIMTLQLVSDLQSDSHPSVSARSSIRLRPTESEIDIQISDRYQSMSNPQSESHILFRVRHSRQCQTVSQWQTAKSMSDTQSMFDPQSDDRKPVKTNHCYAICKAGNRKQSVLISNCHNEIFHSLSVPISKTVRISTYSCWLYQLPMGKILH